ncbi:MAG: alpha/beta hydrolase-fold protein [Chloroflexota bacterium]|nr:esterase family protein [Anaerolineales bacterium]MCA9977939.1 esterase family protein [Anaerolineales bacterium]MCB8967147.1 esterase family protein [Ardenticatenaceae bacterium]
MNREYHRWYSPSLGRDMELLIFGHSGARVLVFPTSKGKFYEWEDRQMMQAVGEHLEKGWLQMYCVDSVDAESWYAHWKHPGDRAWRHVQYEYYLLNEVLPLSWQKNPNPFLITIGASFGAYHAVNLALRHPHLVGRAIGLSGIYDISRWTNGHVDQNVHSNNPVAFIPHEHDPERLAALQKLDVILAVGKDDSLRSSNEQLSKLLWEKGIGNALRLWDGWAHDWPWWQQMVPMYIGGHD